MADVYVPEGPGTFPGLLFLHGGAWKSGNRNQMIKLIQALAEHGYVCMTIDYDLSPGVRFPSALNESLMALQFFRSHATRFKLDPNRVGVAGSSAGGELAALVALSPGKSHGKPTSPVDVALVLNGVLDLTSLSDDDHMVFDYLGGPCETLIAKCTDASPIKHIHPNAPAFFVGHGTADKTVPFAQAEAFVNGLREANVQVQFFVAKGGPHTYWANPSYFGDNLQSILAFLGANLATAHPMTSNGPVDR